MKKLNFFLLAILVPSAQASALYTGFYATGAIGTTQLYSNIDQPFDVSVPGTIDTIVFPSEGNVQDSDIAGWIGLGYSHQFHNHFVLGAEATAGFTDVETVYQHKMVINAGTFMSKISTELTNDFALLFKPGYVIGRTQMYALVGPRWGNFESKQATELQDMIVTDKSSSYQIGITAGVGIEHLLTNHLSLGLEYAYTSYGTVDSLETTGNIDVNGFPAIFTDHADIETATNNVVAQLTYHF
jgi:opacity protein-like surface antigen